MKMIKNASEQIIGQVFYQLGPDTKKNSQEL